MRLGINCTADYMHYNTGHVIKVHIHIIKNCLHFQLCSVITYNLLYKLSIINITNVEFNGESSEVHRK